jgi:phospholipid-binding lipoprotein MlaA
MRCPSLLPVAAGLIFLAALPAPGVSPAAAAEEPAAPPAPAAEGTEAASPEEDIDEEFLEDLFGEEGEEDLFGEEGEDVLIADPLQGYNRAMFWVNDKFYFYLLKPVARGWRAVSPRPVRRGLGNFFSNFFAPVRAANCLLQGKVDDFGNEIGRFMVNSTVGILGFWDQAKRMTGIGPKKEDFGQTLGVWGFGQGFYFVLPLLGPSSPRDTTGFVADFFLDPFYYVVPDRAVVYVVAKSANYVNATSLDADTYEGIKRQALDPYVFLRNAYVQKREADVAK